MTGVFSDPHNRQHLEKLGWELRNRGWTAHVYGAGVGATLRVAHPDATDDTDPAMNASVICPPVRTAGPSMFEWARGGEITDAASIFEAANTIVAALHAPAADR